MPVNVRRRAAADGLSLHTAGISGRPAAGLVAMMKQGAGETLSASSSLLMTRQTGVPSLMPCILSLASCAAQAVGLRLFTDAAPASCGFIGPSRPADCGVIPLGDIHFYISFKIALDIICT